MCGSGASLRQLPGVCTMYCDCYVTAGAEAEAGNTAPRVPWYYLSPRFLETRPHMQCSVVNTSEIK